MSGTATMPLKQRDPIVRRALRTLSDIQRYVDSTRFNLQGLARGLGIPQDELKFEIDWLVSEKYLERHASGSISLTARGKSYEDGAEDELGGFAIEFSEPSKSGPVDDERGKHCKETYGRETPCRTSFMRSATFGPRPTLFPF